MNQYLKAIGAAATGIFGWATFVVNSSSGSITSSEWLLLGGVLLNVLAVFGIPNIGYTQPTLPAPPPPTP